MGDQESWGKLVRRRGLAPRWPVAHTKLTAEWLAGALREATTDERIRATARAVGERMRAEDGVGEAVRAIEARCGERARRAAAGAR